MKPPFRADGNNIYDALGAYIASGISYGVGNENAAELVRLANLGAEIERRTELLAELERLHKFEEESRKVRILVK